MPRFSGRLRHHTALFVFGLFAGWLNQPGVYGSTNVSGNISADTTWTAGGSPYNLTGGVTVNANVTLTIEASVQVNLNNPLTVSANGTLNGTGASFSSGSLTFNDGSTGTLTNCTLSCAVTSYSGQVSINGGSLSSSLGLYGKGLGTSVTGVDLSSCGIYVQLADLDAASVATLLSHVTGNTHGTRQDVQLSGGTTKGSFQLVPLDDRRNYNLVSDATIAGGHTLTVGSGIALCANDDVLVNVNGTLLLASGSGLSLGFLYRSRYSPALVVAGTLEVDAGAQLSGRDGGWYGWTNAHISGTLSIQRASLTGPANWTLDQTCSATITNSDFRGQTLSIHSSSVTVNSCAFLSSSAITVCDTASPNLSYNDFSSCPGYAVNNQGTGLATAEYCWWGAANGPSGDGPGSGYAVYGNVDYTPYGTAPFNYFRIQPYRISDRTGTFNSSGPGTEVHVFNPGDWVRVTLMAESFSSQIKPLAVLNVAPATDHNTLIYDSHDPMKTPSGFVEDNPGDGTLNVGDQKYYSFDFRIPSSAAPGSQYDILGVLRLQNSWSTVLDVTGGPANSGFTDGDWVTGQVVVAGGGGNQVTTNNWLRVQEDGQTYQIKLAMRAGSTPVPITRSLSQQLDQNAVTQIWVEDSGGNVVGAHDALRLVVRAQSAKKYQDQPHEHAVVSADFETVTRYDYTTYPIYATSGWWREMFIYSNFYNNGLDTYSSRVSMYSDVFLDAVLQPDAANGLEDENRIMDGLKAIGGLAVSGITDKLKWPPAGEATANTIYAIATNPSADIDLDKALATTQFVAQCLSDKRAWAPLKLPKISGKYFNKLQLALVPLQDLVADGKKMKAAVLRQQFLQALASAGAEERLDALAAFVNQLPAADPALRDGIVSAQSRFADYQDQFYSSLPGVIRTALGAIDVMDIASFSADLAAVLGQKAAGKVLLPYSLAWEVHKLIREQVNNARYATLGATLALALDTAAGLDQLKSQVESSGLVDSNKTLQAVRLLEAYYYLGHYSYARTLDTLNNPITRVGGWFFSDYQSYMNVLQSEEQNALARLMQIAEPRFLTMHADAYQLGQTDDEYGWLQSLITDTRPQDPTPPLKAIFQALGATQGAAPLSVCFLDTSIGATQWTWSFGDGATQTYPVGSGRIFTHLYPTPGVYAVVLTVSNGTQTDTAPAQTIVAVNSAPVAAFSITNASGAAPLNVTFRDQSTGTRTNWDWSFGDGGTSTETNPSHSYANPGIYTVTLRVTGPGGTNLAAQPNCITVTGSTGTIAVNCSLAQGAWSLSGPKAQTGSGTTNTFTGMPTGAYTIQYGTQPGYLTPASEQKTLASGETLTFTGTYTDGNTPPVASAGSDITVTDNNNSGYASVTLDGSQSHDPDGTITSYAWAEGATPLGTGPTLTLSFGVGAHVVTLTVTDDQGLTGTATVNVTVNRPPVITTAPATSPSPAIAGQVVAFTCSATDPDSDQLDYTWNFGDGGVGYGSAPTHTYVAAGDYAASVAVSDNKGGVATAALVVHVVAAIPDLTVVSLAAQPATPRAGQPVTFTAAIENNGSAAASAFTIGFWKHLTSAPTQGQAPEQTAQLAGLAAGQTVLVQFTANATATGSFNAWAYADTTGAVSETDETNNAAGLPYNVVANQAPAIRYGPLATPNPVALPASTTVLIIASDPDNGPQPLAYTWSKVSGPGNVSFASNGTTSSDVTSAAFDAWGVYALQVEVFDGMATVSGQVNVIVDMAPPTITGIDVLEGTSAGGTAVVITGQNFVSGLAVHFGDAAAQYVALVDANTIHVVTPAHLAAVVDVLVTNPDGQTVTSPTRFTYRDPPAITSAPTSSANAGQVFSYSITATNSPTSYGSPDLPSWASVNTTTGLITGTPYVSGWTGFTISATNAFGTSSASLWVQVRPGPANKLLVSGFPSPVTVGTLGDLTVTVQDAYGNTPTGYTGTVHFTSSDPAAVLPRDYIFETDDAGVRKFEVTLKTAGTQLLSATDTANPEIKGTQSGINVNAGTGQPGKDMQVVVWLTIPASVSIAWGEGTTGKTAGDVTPLNWRVKDASGDQLGLRETCISNDDQNNMAMRIENMSNTGTNARVSAAVTDNGGWTIGNAPATDTFAMQAQLGGNALETLAVAAQELTGTTTLAKGADQALVLTVMTPTGITHDAGAAKAILVTLTATPE